MVCDEEQRNEASEAREGEAGHRHEQARGEQRAAAPDAMRKDAKGDGEEGRAEQRRGRDRANREGAVAEQGQVHREQHGDVAVAEGAQGAGQENAADVRYSLSQRERADSRQRAG
jgi:hypothetical protein